MNRLSSAIARWGINAGNTTIRRRWMTLFVFFVAVPILIIIILFLNSLRNEANEQAAGYSERYVSQVQKTLLSHMEHVEAISSSAIRSIYDELINDSDLQGQYEEYYTFSNLFNSVADETLIDRFRLYAPRSKVYAHQMESFCPLDFLEEGREYEARIWFDDPNVPTKTRVGLREITVDSETVLDISLGAAGGQAIQFMPKNTGSR